MQLIPSEYIILKIWRSSISKRDFIKIGLGIKDNNAGTYISLDPIKLAGNSANLGVYVCF